jgi:hypothetical protein
VNSFQAVSNGLDGNHYTANPIDSCDQTWNLGHFTLTPKSNSEAGLVNLEIADFSRILVDPSGYLGSSTTSIEQQSSEPLSTESAPVRSEGLFNSVFTPKGGNSHNIDSVLQTNTRVDTNSDLLVTSDNSTVVPFSHFVRSISNLNADLYDFAATIPTVQACWSSAGYYQPLEGKEFALGQMLELSQRFIEIMDRLVIYLSPITSNSYDKEDPTLPQRTQTDERFNSMSTPMNQSYELLVLSSYTTIVLAYHCILEHIAACIKNQHSTRGQPFNPSHAHNYPRLPSLAVGTFTMSSSSSTQVLMLVHMIDTMMTRCRCLVKCMLGKCKPSLSTQQKEFGIDTVAREEILTMGQAALERFQPQEDAILTLLGEVRKDLLELGYMH